MKNDSPYRALAETYEAIRPGYPEALIDDLFSHAAPTNSGPLLEIGAGTGKATQALLERGFSVDAVEPDADMAALLERKLRTPKLRLFVSSFETFRPPCRAYPMICCAQAFHWLDRDTKFGRCAQLLAPEGCLVLFWYDPLPAEACEANQAAEQVKRRYFGTALEAKAVSLDTREQEIQAAKAFRLVFWRQYTVVLHNTPEQALQAMASTPAFQEAMGKLPPEDRRAFSEEFRGAVRAHGGRMEAPMQYSLYVLRKK